MTCPQVQTNLSLYLYGELEFAQEEAIERHLESCAFCQLALTREKEWHASLNAERQDVSLELLADCRGDLRTALRSERGQGWLSGPWSRLLSQRFSPTRRSLRLATASFLVLAGFAGARLMDSGLLPMISASGTVNRMGLLDTAHAQVRDIQPNGQDGVRIVVDQMQQHEVTGKLDDTLVRQLLLSAMQDSADPGVRVDSVEILQHQTSPDVRDALLNSARNDLNAAVRIKALQGLAQFPSDLAIRAALEYILKHDSSAAVRSEAIDILLPLQAPGSVVSPDVLTTLQDILRSQQQDTYVRSRSQQVVAAAEATRIY
ncbi:MAG TPA: HEAT repeat domain-containing protein [Bryobacteraceae bacterium]|jgi:hypothetical protein|nr:HEAT repeat domain-containing protein [Bryobacteraceae bacterium]